MNNTLIEKIRNSVIGDRQLIRTSFGEKPLIYADYTASGRSLSFVEDYIRQQVMPFYANTHTETSFSGAQTTKLREQARQLIREAVNAGQNDKVIFCGPGATAVINKFIDILNIRLPHDLSARYELSEKIPAEQRPVVFIGPYEHHSNELPWRESIADLEVISIDDNGQIDISQLRQKLEQYQDRPQLIGSFSAASNVTGIKTDVDKISALLHEYGAVSCWDYAAAAPYVGLDMNPVGAHQDCTKDAVFISPHKFIGGPGSPGILIVKEHLLTNTVPALPGGGTVVYVTPNDHSYITDTERREEGGTPAIIESIRAGLAFKLQQEVGTDVIEAAEHNFIQRALQRWKKFTNIEILGNPEADRLAIVSLRIKHQGKDLHYGFVVALLNDLFGIQARGGCSCAGPYGHSLLNMDMTYSKALEEEIAKGLIVLRPGWVRLNFNYFIDEQSFEYIVRAIELVAEYGTKLLPFYHFDTQSGCWRFQKKKMKLPSDLLSLDFESTENEKVSVADECTLAQILENVADQLESDSFIKGLERFQLHLPEDAEKLRWFLLPQEA